MKTRIAIFASGGGSNAEVILKHFNQHKDISINLVVSNKAEAFVLERAKKYGVNTFVHTKQDIDSGKIETELEKHQIDFIVLAGYLQKISAGLISRYPKRIVNIHPALLPNYGGKGMYGMHVHRAVVANHEKVSGITIHYVNENYDEGSIIEQHQCKLETTMSAEQVQEAVLKLEHQFFAPCIERVIEDLNN